MPGVSSWTSQQLSLKQFIDPARTSDPYTTDHVVVFGEGQPSPRTISRVSSVDTPSNITKHDTLLKNILEIGLL